MGTAVGGGWGAGGGGCRMGPCVYGTYICDADIDMIVGIDVDAIVDGGEILFPIKDVTAFSICD